MFIGHWAPALAAAALPRSPRIGTLFVAGQLVDWGFFALLLVGVEHMRFSPGITAMNPMDLYDMPWTHSLLGSAAWAAGFALALLFATRDRRAALVAGAVVLSHWLLDLLVHAPDLTLAGSPPKLGLALWDHPWIEMPLELGLTFAALAFYVRRRQPSTARVALLAGILLLLQGGNWFGSVEPQVTVATSLVAFLAYGLATLAAWWMGKSEQSPARAD